MSIELGERFAHAVATRDAKGLAGLLTPAVDFRALTPGAVWERDEATAVVEVILGTWFAPDRKITDVLSVESSSVGSVGHVAYRFAAERPDGAFTIEQQAYFRADADRIGWLRILCSGFVSAA
jgi:hypothetical protein